MHRAGAQTIAADSLRHIVRRNRTGHANHRRLRSAVNEPRRHALQRGRDRGHVDDDPIMPRNHARQEGPHGAEHGPAVQLEREFPIRFGGLQQSALMHEARAVEQNVHRPGFRRRLRDPSGIEDIQHCRPQPRRLKVRQFCRVHIGGDHARPGGRERQSGSTPDPLRGGGDEGGFAGEAGHTAAP